MSTPLQKFTTEYLPEEDRIRLLCALQGEHTLTLWLTQRLLQRLVTPLCQWLQAQPRAGMPAAYGAQAVPTSAAYAMAQQGAQSALADPPPTPVPASAPGPQRLVHAVQAQVQGHQLQLTFQAAAMAGAAVAAEGRATTDAIPQAYTMAFTPTSLRQWLGILYRHAVQAQWPLEVWPQWFSVGEQADSAGPVVTLH